MIRGILLVGLLALLVPGTAPGQGENPRTEAQKLEEIYKLIQSLRTDYEFQKSVDLDNRLREIEERLRRTEDVARTTINQRVSNFSPTESTVRKANELLIRLRDLEDRVQRLEEQPSSGGTTGRISRSLGNNTSSIRLRNTSGMFATVYVNGVAYDMNPRETRTLTNQPAGAFNYEVEVEGYGVVRPLTRRSLYGTGDIYEITIYPPR